MVEMDTEDDPLGKEVMAAEAAKKMAEKVADMRKRKGARVATPTKTMDKDIREEDGLGGSLYAQCLI